MNQYTLWKWKSGKWQRQGTIYAASAQAALDNQGGNRGDDTLPQCITDGTDPNGNQSCILAGFAQ